MLEEHPGQNVPELGRGEDGFDDDDLPLLRVHEQLPAEAQRHSIDVVKLRRPLTADGFGYAMTLSNDLMVMMNGGNDVMI